MTIAIIVYGLSIGLLASIGAWLAERAQIALRRPRRFAWIGGVAATLLLPVLMLSLRDPGQTARATITADIMQVTHATLSPPWQPVGSSLAPLPDWPSVDVALALLWALVSVVLVGAYVFSAWRLKNRSSGWGAAYIDTSSVNVSQDVGPAVFGWLSPRMVFPRWLTEAPLDVQRLVLAHEREHLATRDPQVLAIATLLTALLPWNLPLHWMLRRMRFAMEVDCDSRVIRGGADPSDYGLALLYVSERQAHAPRAAIALIERTSQLERRINFMFVKPRKRALIAGACLALAGTCLFAAAELDPPSVGAAPTVLKPPPANDADNPSYRLGRRFELLLRERYPELLTEEVAGIPVIVALVNDDLSIANSAQIDTIPPDGRLDATPDLFAAIGLAEDQVPYAGVMSLRRSPESRKHVAVVYTERGRRNAYFVSKLHPDTRKQDRELFAQQFPEAVSGVAAGEAPWLLMDRTGAMLRKGVEPITPNWEKTLAQRYKGITTHEMTVTPIMDDAGNPLRDKGGKALQLYVVWLAPGSTLPQD